MIKKDGAIFRNVSAEADFSILVDLTTETKDMKFYVVPTHLIDTWLRQSFDGWVRTPGKNNRPHDEANKKRNLNQKAYKTELQTYLNRWEELGLE